MPNPKNVATTPARDPATVPLLRRIWSGHVGTQQLPPAETATDDEMSVVIDAAELGRVRIYYRRQRYRHYRNTRWMWAADRAETAPGAPLGVSPQAAMERSGCTSDSRHTCPDARRAGPPTDR